MKPPPIPRKALLALVSLLTLTLVGAPVAVPPAAAGPRPPAAAPLAAAGADPVGRRTHRRGPAEGRRQLRPSRAVLLRPAGPVRQRRHRATTRAACTGDRLRTGFDPTDKGFYHGGDLKGVIDKLDYIQGLGTTAIWLAPIFKNRPVQGTGDGRLGRLPRLLDHRLHPGRPALRHQRGPEAAGQARPPARHQGLPRRHHQPHRRRHPVRRGQVRVRRQGDLAVHRRAGAGVRGPQLRRRHPGLPGGRHATSFPYTPVVRQPRGRERQGAGLAERPDDVPQPGRLHLRRREQRVRRLLRPRRPVDRASRGGPGHDEGLRRLDRRDRRRRLPARHRQARQHGVLAAVQPGHRARPRTRPASRTSSCSARSTAPTRRSARTYVRQGGLPATLDFAFQDGRAGASPPAAAPAKALRRRVRRRRPLHRRRHRRRPAAHLPRQPRHGPHRLVHRRRRHRPGQPAAPRPARPRADVPHPRPAGGLLRRRAGLHRPGGDKDARQDMFASQVADYLDDDLLGTDRTHAQRPVRHRRTRSTGPSPTWRRCARPTRRCATACRSPGTRPTAPASSPSPGSTAPSRTEYVVAVNNADHRADCHRGHLVGRRHASPASTAARRGEHGRRRRRADRHRAGAVGARSYRAGTPVARAADQAAHHHRQPGSGRAGRHPGGGHRRGDRRPAGHRHVAARVGRRPVDAAGHRRPRARTRVHHDLTGLAGGTPRRVQGGGRATAAGRTATARSTRRRGDPGAGPAPGSEAVVHYQRPAGGYDDWGLYAWGDIDAGVRHRVAEGAAVRRARTPTAGSPG